MFSHLSSHFEQPSSSNHAITARGIRELNGLLQPAGSKCIATSFVYEVEEAMLTPEEHAYFLNCVGSRDIHNARMPSGAELFARIERHPDYYVGYSEEILLRNLEVKRLAQNSIVTELGPGDGQKAAIFFSRHSPSTAITYQAIDTSGDFLEMTASKVSAFQSIDQRMYCGDFFCIPKSFGKADTVLFLGTTISNFDRTSAERLLTHIRNDYLKEGGTLILGQDSNHDRARLQRCYDDCDKHTATFVLNALRSIKQSYLPSLDLNTFRYHAYFDERNETMRMGILVTQDSVIETELGPIFFEQGEFISVGQSRKYSIDSITQMTKAAGFTSIETLSAETGVNIHSIR